MAKKPKPGPISQKTLVKLARRRDKREKAEAERASRRAERASEREIARAPTRQKSVKRRIARLAEHPSMAAVDALAAMIRNPALKPGERVAAAATLLQLAVDASPRAPRADKGKRKP